MSPANGQKAPRYKAKLASLVFVFALKVKESASNQQIKSAINFKTIV